MTDTGPLMIDCEPHGTRVAAVVCCHLLDHEHAPAGFVENSDDPNDLQAWCGMCEKMFQSEHGMTDAFRDFNAMTVICVACYAEAKAHHSPMGRS